MGTFCGNEMEWVLSRLQNNPSSIRSKQVSSWFCQIIMLKLPCSFASQEAMDSSRKSWSFWTSASKRHGGHCRIPKSWPRGRTDRWSMTTGCLAIHGVKGKRAGGAKRNHRQLGRYASQGHPWHSVFSWFILYPLYLLESFANFHCQQFSSWNILEPLRQAYTWLKDNTPEDARVMAWWDYGYQIAGIANRTTIADGNTWTLGHQHQCKEKELTIADTPNILVVFSFGVYLGATIFKHSYMMLDIAAAATFWIYCRSPKAHALPPWLSSGVPARYMPCTASRPGWLAWLHQIQQDKHGINMHDSWWLHQIQ